MRGTARRRSGLGGLVAAALLLLAGCGASEPEPVVALPPEAPADLCALVPAEAKVGLIASSSTDVTGNPTAACSLRSADKASPEVRSVITWLQLNDEESADQVYGSQCRAIDTTIYREAAGFSPKGADESCAGSGTVDGADSATLAALTGQEVLTVRFESEPAGKVPALGRAQVMLEGAIAGLGDNPS